MGKKCWFRWLVGIVVAIVAGTFGLNLLLAANPVRTFLTAELSAAFGRPVEVSRFHFTILDGPRIEARYITVAEDPRFGHEYFLRAEKLTAGPRWRSLLRGRFDFGTLTLTRPSVNLVRLPDGQWNLEHWLPPLESPPGAVSARTPAGARAPVPPYVLKVDSGRINFKRGVDKHPFALVDLNGRVDQESGGRWRIDLEARLARAAVDIQEAGVIRVRGRVGGTSARLRPAELTVTWEEASLADALRLLRGWDSGVRGALSAEFTASSGLPGAQQPSPGPLSPWEFSGTLRVLDMHRWDLPHHAGDPAFNLQLQARWWPERARVEVERAVFEAARSNLRASGHVEWAQPGASSLRLISSGVDLDDALAYFRAFRHGVADNLALEGSAGVDFELDGWPPRVVRGVVATDGARLRVPGLAAAVAVGRSVLRVEKGKVELLPTTLTLATSRDAFRLDGVTTLGPPWRYLLNFSGQTAHLEDLQTITAALGWPRGEGWTIQGPAGVLIRWQGSLFPFAAQSAGALDLRGVRLQPPFLSEPIILAARWEFQGSDHRVALSSATAFGARWTGTLASSGAGAPWEFALAADQLDIAAVNRWVRRAQPSLLQRVVPGRTSAEALAGLDAVRARGNLAAARVVLAPLELRRFRAQIDWRGRRLEIQQGEADFYSGSLRGSFRAEFADQPAYDAEFNFTRVDLAQLSGAVQPLRGRFAGKASGEFALVARGAEREALVASLEGRGMLDVRDAQLRGINLLDSFAAGRRQPGISAFRSAAGAFTLSNRAVEVRGFRLSSPAAELEAQGRADFSPALDLLVRVLPPVITQPAGAGRVPSFAGLPAVTGKSFRLAGPLSSPQITVVETAPPPRP